MSGRKTITAALLGAALLVAGCGDDSPSLSDAELREQANTACRELSEKISALGDGADTPEELQDATREIDEAVSETMDRIRDLKAESGAAQRAIDGFTNAFDEGKEQVGKLQDALQGDDPDRFEQAREELDQASERIDQAAQDAGLDACADL